MAGVGREGQTKKWRRGLSWQAEGRLTDRWQVWEARRYWQADGWRWQYHVRLGLGRSELPRKTFETVEIEGRAGLLIIFAERAFSPAALTKAAAEWIR